MAWTASMVLRSTSRSAVSTSRAKNGAAPPTNGGIAPATPSEVPASNTVSGIITISRMMKGTERNRLTASANPPLTTRFCQICPGLVSNSSTPSGKPSARVSNSEPPSIASVSRQAWPISLQSTLANQPFMPPPRHADAAPRARLRCSRRTGRESAGRSWRPSAGRSGRPGLRSPYRSRARYG